MTADDFIRLHSSSVLLSSQVEGGELVAKEGFRTFLEGKSDEHAHETEGTTRIVKPRCMGGWVGGGRRGKKGGRQT